MSDSLNIGQIIEVPRERDAIHVAVAPVVANGPLLPGEAISLLEDGSASVNPPFIGVVDPFLTRRVQAGERFWMFLRPGTITSLRHEWSHPAFATEERKEPDKSESEKWLREYAERLNPYSLGGNYGENVTDEGKEQAFRELIEDLNRGEIYARGSDLHGLYELEQSDLLRHHASIYLGRPITWENFGFTCSC
jgi:hypothetical protein